MNRKFSSKFAALCTKNEIRRTVIPVPRNISSECAMAIGIDESDRETVKRLCLQEEIATECRVAKGTGEDRIP